MTELLLRLHALLLVVAFVVPGLAQAEAAGKVTAKDLAASYSSALACDDAARAFLAASPDKGWALFSQCTTREDFLELEPLLDAWLPQVKSRADGMHVLVRVIARRQKTLVEDVQRCRAVGINLITTDDVFPPPAAKGKPLPAVDLKHATLVSRATFLGNTDPDDEELYEFDEVFVMDNAAAKARSAQRGRDTSAYRQVESQAWDQTRARNRYLWGYDKSGMGVVVPVGTGLRLSVRYTKPNPFFKKGQDYFIYGTLVDGGPPETAYAAINIRIINGFKTRSAGE